MKSQKNEISKKKMKSKKNEITKKMKSVSELKNFRTQKMSGSDNVRI